MTAANQVGVSEPSLETIETIKQKKQEIPEPPTGPLKYEISENEESIKLDLSSPRGLEIKGYVIEKQDNAMQQLTMKKFNMPSVLSDWKQKSAFFSTSSSTNE